MTYSKVKFERIKQCKTQNDLSKESGVCRTTISQIENGKLDNIQFGTLKKIAAALNSSFEELFLDE